MNNMYIEFAGVAEVDPSTVAFWNVNDESVVDGVTYMGLPQDKKNEFVIHNFNEAIGNSINIDFETLNTFENQ